MIGLSWGSVSDCARAAIRNRFPGFALQAGGQCFGSADMFSTYARLGSSNGCSNGNDSAISCLRWFGIGLHRQQVESDVVYEYCRPWWRLGKRCLQSSIWRWNLRVEQENKWAGDGDERLGQSHSSWPPDKKWFLFVCLQEGHMRRSMRHIKFYVFRIKCIFSRRVDGLQAKLAPSPLLAVVSCWVTLVMQCMQHVSKLCYCKVLALFGTGNWVNGMPDKTMHCVSLRWTKRPFTCVLAWHGWRVMSCSRGYGVSCVHSWIVHELKWCVQRKLSTACIAIK